MGACLLPFGGPHLGAMQATPGRGGRGFAATSGLDVVIFPWSHFPCSTASHVWVCVLDVCVCGLLPRRDQRQAIVATAALARHPRHTSPVCQPATLKTPLL